MASGIGNSRNTGIGNQLARRVQSGQITQAQAQKTSNQRALLAKAFGPEWRVKVYGNKEGAKGIGGPFARGQIAAKRQSALERAKTKLAVGAPPVTLKNGGTQAPGGKRQQY